MNDQEEEEGHEEAQTILFATEEYRLPDLREPYIKKEMLFFPCDDESWNFENIQLFLNGLADFDVGERSRVVRKAYDPYFTMIFAHQNDEERTIRFTYYFETQQIVMKASSHWITNYWKKQIIKKKTSIGTRDRKMSVSTERELAVFYFSVSIDSVSSLAIRKKLQPIFYSYEDFSLAYQCFIRSFCKHLVGDDLEKAGFGMDFYKCWFENDSVCTKKTKESFFENNEGFVRFHLMKEQAHTKNILIEHDGEEYSIVRGIYISPFAQSICLENDAIFHGILLDTTWKTLPCYVTSILMASICNVGIPLGFTFGPGEDKTIYKMFYDVFQEVINVDLSKFTIESDRGSALMAIAAEMDMEHLACNHHMLRSLKSTEFSQQIGELISCKCITDFDILKKHYAEEFSKFIGTEKIEILNNNLMKCGLIFDVELKEIKVHDDTLWDHIGLLNRIKYKMPTTTNSLESSHGHLNAKIPKRNDFYTAMSRLIKFVIKKTHNFEQAYQTNLNRSIRLIKRRCSQPYQQLIEKESKQYETTIDTCNCGETKLLSAMMMVDIPCSHRYSKGAAFPSKPIDLKLKYKNNFQKFVTDFVIEEGHTEKRDFTYADYINEKAAKTVRKFSKEKKLKKIIKAIPKITIDDETQFANGKPLGFHKSVSSGIHLFHKKNEKNYLNSETSEDTTESSSDGR